MTWMQFLDISIFSIAMLLLYLYCCSLIWNRQNRRENKKTNVKHL